jgi:hypothetical protein
MKTCIAALVAMLLGASAAGAESALPLPCTGCPPGSALANALAFAAVSAIALRWRRT